MKKLFFVRHAKSSWSDISKDDFDRGLNKRGKRDAPMMAQRLAEYQKEIDIAVVSAAARAVKTAKSFVKHLDIKHYTEEHKLYHAWTDAILEVVNEIDDVHSSALIFGHNPGFTYVFNHFADAPISNLPTCGLFEVISTASKWEDVDTSNSKIGIYWYPKMFL